jgi:hypothetical protein
VEIAASIAQLSIALIELLLVLGYAGNGSRNLEAELADFFLPLIVVMVLVLMLPVFAFDDLGEFLELLVHLIHFHGA